MSSLRGKVVVITGAAGGLGGALCRSFAGEGCDLFVSDYDKDRLQPIIDELSGTGARIAGEPVDLAHASQAGNVIEQAIRTYGRIDTLVNNAGISRVKDFWSLAEDDWDVVFNVNVKALFFALQAAARHMTPHGGSIINVASVAGRLPRPSLLPYAASKAAVISITRSAALALAGSNIRVNAVAPGMIDTEMLQTIRSDLGGSSTASAGSPPGESGIPLGRIAQPEEVAAAVLFLASDAAAYITGQTLNVCGGICMS